jgi:protein CWC15
MTTAHRPTWNPTSGGKDQGGNRVIVPTRQYSAKDLPGHTVLKYRKLGQSSESETKSINYKDQLLTQEKHYFDEKQNDSNSSESSNSIRNSSPLSSSSSESHPHKARFLLPESKPSKLKENHSSDLEAKSDLSERDESDKIDKSDKSDKSDLSDLSDASDSSDFSEEEIRQELEKIKKERAEASKALRESEEQKLRDHQKQEMLKKNPLLDIAPGFELKRKWTEETIFSNQSRNEPKAHHRFVNDTLRSDFHRKFLHRTIL